MKIITIEEFPIRGRFVVKIRNDTSKKVDERDHFNAGNAAAHALQATFRATNYVIVGTNEVLKLIPKNLHSK